MEIFGYTALIGIGLVLGLLGGGGALLAIPVLVYLFSLDVTTASSYSLFIVGTTSLVGVLLKQKNRLVDLPVSMGFGGSSLVSSFVVRKWCVPAIPDTLSVFDVYTTKRDLLLVLFALVAIASSIVALRRKNPREDQRSARPNLLYLLPTGLLTGGIAGLVGAGGGFIILPALLLFGRLHFNVAVGTTLVVIAANSLFGFMGDVLNHGVHWHFLLLITALSVVGMLLGNWYASIIAVQYLRRSFGWITLSLGLFVLIAELW